MKRPRVYRLHVSPAACPGLPDPEPPAGGFPLIVRGEHRVWQVKHDIYGWHPMLNLPLLADAEPDRVPHLATLDSLGLSVGDEFVLHRGIAWRVRVDEVKTLDGGYGCPLNVPASWSYYSAEQFGYEPLSPEWVQGLSVEPEPLDVEPAEPGEEPGHWVDLTYALTPADGGPLRYFRKSALRPTLSTVGDLRRVAVEESEGLVQLLKAAAVTSGQNAPCQSGEPGEEDDEYEEYLVTDWRELEDEPDVDEEIELVGYAFDEVPLRKINANRQVSVRGGLRPPDVRHVMFYLADEPGFASGMVDAAVYKDVFRVRRPSRLYEMTLRPRPFTDGETVHGHAGEVRVTAHGGNHLWSVLWFLISICPPPATYDVEFKGRSTVDSGDNFNPRELDKLGLQPGDRLTLVGSVVWDLTVESVREEVCAARHFPQFDTSGIDLELVGRAVRSI